MSDLRRSSEDAGRSTCPTSSRRAQRIASGMQHRRSESASTVTTSSTITPPTITRRHPLTSAPPDTSFDNDSDVSGPPSPPPSSDMSKHNRRDASPEASTSTRPLSTSSSPRLPYSLNTPDRSISSVLESSRRWETPQTPQTPGAGSSTDPSTTSPVSRAKPRFKHSSSDTPLRKADSQPVQVLPFPLTSMQDKYQQSGKVTRVRFSDAHPRSMPKLSAATFAPPTASRANTSPSLLSVPPSPTAESSSRSRSRTDSHSRRESAQVSSTAASAPSSGSWQRKVAEEMIRLSFNASNTSLSSVTKRNSRHSTGTRSSGEFQQAHLDPRLAKSNKPTAAPKVPPVPFPSTPGKQETAPPKSKPKTRQTRSNTTPSPKKPPFEPKKDKENDVHRQHRLSSLIRNAAEAAPVEVRVVKQESFDHPDSRGINTQQWRLEVDVPNPSLGIPIAGHSSDDKGKAPETAESSPDKENDGDAEESETNEPVLKPRPGERKVRRSIRSRNSSGARSLAAARSAGASSTPDIAEGVVAPPAVAARTGSVPSLNTRLNALRQSSQNTLQSPSTPPRPSNISHPSSPDDSPTPSRRRLSSYAIEPSALFFAPRANPPPVAEPSTMADSEPTEEPTSASARLPRISTSGLAPPRPSSGSIDQQSAVPSSSRPTSSYVTAPQSTISTPRPSLHDAQTRTVEREEDVVSVGKGKGKRLFEDVEPEADVPEASGSGSVEGGVGVVLGNGLVIPPRQRLESNLTRYTDDDTIGELPVNPRKRMKMTSSAHIVQTLTEAAAAQSSPDSSYEHQPSPSEQAPRGILNKSPPPGSTPEAGPSRPSSRRSQSVSFTLQAGSVRDGAGSPSVASTRHRRPLSVGSRPISPSESSSRSIPLMAIISPRPASFVPAPSSSRNGYHQQYHLREPRRYSTASRPVSLPSTQQSPTSPHSMSYMQSMTSTGESPVRSAFSQHVATSEKGGGQRFPTLPFQGWAFFLGFLLPFFWWVASFTHVDYDAYAMDAEAGAGPRHAPIEIITWRRRCRLMSVFSIIVYIPVIVLAVVFGR
ncbi:hypothetical protein FRC05_002226 [Tulasnella sp. 425]|nr:hypothetical protein FRC05_002226 [Tulasnella sp. 425]